MNKEIIKYDKKNNLVYYKYLNGERWYEEWYEDNNLIHFKNNKRKEYWYKYDENNNRIKISGKGEAKHIKMINKSIFWTIFWTIFGTISFISLLFAVLFLHPHAIEHSKQNIKYHNKKEIISELQLIKEKINIDNNNFIPLTEKEQILSEIKKDILNIIEKVEKEN